MMCPERVIFTPNIWPANNGNIVIPTTMIIHDNMIILYRYCTNFFSDKQQCGRML